MNPYRILGVTRHATKNAIRQAYLAKVKVYHPDVNKTASASRTFRQIQEAYSILSQQDSRQNYDRQSGYQAEFGTESQQDEAFAKKFREQTEALRQDKQNAYWNGFEKYRDATRSNPSWQTASSFKDWPFIQTPSRIPFRINIFMTFIKILPLLVAPCIFFGLLFRFYKLSEDSRQRHSIVYDAQGRAYLVDGYGRRCRVSELDRIHTQKK